VLDAGVGGLGDAAALAVGGDAAGGLEAGGHRGGGGAFLFPGVCLVGGAGGFLQVAALAGGDEAVRAGAGEVRLGQVAGVAEGQPDLPGPRAAGRFVIMSAGLREPPLSQGHGRLTPSGTAARPG